MYIEAPGGYYTNDGQQACRMGRFLILCDTGGGPIHGIVRKVALRQCGHLMMGKARIDGKSYTVSGSYGNDGLPMHFDTLPHDAKPLPEALVEEWNNGGGWNGAGKEAVSMRKWALENFK